MDIAPFVIRLITAADVPALAKLHVDTFNETHCAPGRSGPSFELRSQQWRDLYANSDGSWFCLVVENAGGQMVGFARGMPYTGDLSGFTGELNKIYMLRAYHRRGLGRQLLGSVARRLLAQGIDSMLLFGDAQNPSNGFYETMGAERLLAANGDFHGGYGWRDLRKLAEICLAG